MFSDSIYYHLMLSCFFSFHILIILLPAFNAQSCPNNCNNQGLCDKYSRCTCSEGFQGADCSEKICPFDYAWSDESTAIDKAHKRMECSNRGVCTRSTGDCACMDGFTGQSCERLGCNLNCNGYGKCTTLHDRANRYRDDNSIKYTYNYVWDANKIMGCMCDRHFHGYDCSLRTCPDGDDPLTTSQVNEIQLIQCIAISGSFVLYYKGYPSATIPYNANAATLKAALLKIPLLTGITVTFSISSGKVCQTSINAIKIEFTTQFGSRPPLVAVANTVMSTAGGAVTVVADGVSSITDSLGVTYFAKKGTKEAEDCANRGLCTTSDGTCSCYTSNGDVYSSSDGYGGPGTRGDCGYIYSGTTVSTCPGEVQCSGHGVCDQTTYRCTCSAGYTSGDCSLRSCPQGLSWFQYPTANEETHSVYSECSEMGICDPSSGRCTCRSGFYGEACQFMACGGGVSTPCNGHGRCMNMAELALWAHDNGDATSYTYGLDPNNAYTWDAYRVHGCFCDEGFEGYDCSLRSCPMGDDAGTYDDHAEVQLLTCIADEGSFTLTFRQKTTGPIYVNATKEELEFALEQLSTLTDLAVYFSLDALPPNVTLSYSQPSKLLPEGFPNWGKFNTTSEDVVSYHKISRSKVLSNSSVCTTDGSQVVVIHFETIHGDLPSLTAGVSLLALGGNVGSGVIDIGTDGKSVTGLNNKGWSTTLTSIKGTTEMAVCNNRGLCNKYLGLCNCFSTWSSSDGKGGPGEMHDCGYRNKHLYSEFDSFRIDT